MATNSLLVRLLVELSARSRTSPLLLLTTQALCGAGPASEGAGVKPAQANSGANSGASLAAGLVMRAMSVSKALSSSSLQVRSHVRACVQVGVSLAG